MPPLAVLLSAADSAAQRPMIVNHFIRVSIASGEGAQRKMVPVEGCLKVRSEELLREKSSANPPPIFDLQEKIVTMVVPTGGTDPQPTKIIAEGSTATLLNLKNASTHGELQIFSVPDSKCGG